MGVLFLWKKVSEVAHETPGEAGNTVLILLFFWKMVSELLATDVYSALMHVLILVLLEDGL